MSEIRTRVDFRHHKHVQFSDMCLKSGQNFSDHFLLLKIHSFMHAVECQNWDTKVSHFRLPIAKPRMSKIQTISAILDCFFKENYMTKMAKRPRLAEKNRISDVRFEKSFLELN